MHDERYIYSISHIYDIYIYIVIFDYSLHQFSIGGVVCTSVCLYIYIYIERERERDYFFIYIALILGAG